MRYALYFAPPEHDPLSAAGARWLGRDPFSGEGLPLAGRGPFESTEIEALTGAPRRYGFHATLKAPFELAAGRSVEELLAEMEIFAGETEAFEIPSVTVRRLGPFFALVPAVECAALQAFAAGTVRRFEPFRAALSAADLSRRKPDTLPAHQRENLFTWGYPYVFEDFLFHMTLTGAVPQDRAAAMAEILEETFAPFTGRPLPVSHIALFMEPERGAPFTVHSLMPLGGVSRRKIA